MKNTGQLYIRDSDGGVVLMVKVVPASSRDGIVGVLGEVLKVTTARPAERGKANDAVRKTLASVLGVDLNRVKLLSGRASPRKKFHVDGISAEKIRQRLCSYSGS